MPETIVNVNIGTLSMDLPARDEAHGRQLALAVIRTLETLPPLPTPGESLSISTLRVDVPHFPPGTDDGNIARTVATAIHGSLAQTMGLPGPTTTNPSFPFLAASGKDSRGHDKRASAVQPRRTKSPRATEDQRGAAAATESTGEQEDWDFTEADLDTLKKHGGELTFAGDSDWFPPAFKRNLKKAIEKVLQRRPLSSLGVSGKDFYHGHVMVPNSVASSDQLKKLRADFDQVSLVEGVAAGSVGDRAKLLVREERTAGALLEAIEKIPGVVIVYHSFEFRTPAEKIAADSPRRNLVSRLGHDDIKAAPSSQAGSAADVEHTHSGFLQFAFLVDQHGVVHVIPGGSSDLPLITGQAGKKTPPPE